MLFVLLEISFRVIKTSCGRNRRRFAATDVHVSFMRKSGSSPSTRA